MKPLDFVKTKTGNIGIITEVSTTQGRYSASIEFLNTFAGEKVSWWTVDEFDVIDNLPDLLSRKLKHPMGCDSLQPFKTDSCIYSDNCEMEENGNCHKPNCESYHKK